MKKALVILLAVLLVATAAFTLSACDSCKKGLHRWDDNNAVVTTPATCEQEGEQTVYCLKCGESKTKTLPKSDHSWDEQVAAKDPSCDSVGNIAYNHCSVCNKFYNEQGEQIEENSWVVGTEGGHKLGSLVAAKAASCEQSGNLAYYQCSSCKKYFADEDATTEIDDVVIPAFGHTWAVATNAWTWATDYSSVELNLVCTSNAAHTTHVTLDDIDIDDSNAPTCTQDGDYTYSVSLTKQALEQKLANGKLADSVGATLSDSKQVTRPMTGHNYEGQDWLPDGSGNHYQECANGCGINSAAVPCTTQLAWNDEQHYQECTVCHEQTEKESHDGDEIGKDGIGHWIVCDKQGCEGKAAYTRHEYGTVYGSDGTHHWDKCKDTGCNYENEESKSTHSVDEWLVGDGIHVGECEICGEDMSGEHNLSHVNGRDVTCTENGIVEHWYCDVCDTNFRNGDGTDEVDDVVITAQGHQLPNIWSHEGDEFGKHHRACSVCGQMREDGNCSVTANLCATCEHTYSAEEILDALYALTSGSLSGTYVLTGTVTIIGSNNFTMTIDDDGEHREVYVYNPSGSGANALRNVVVGARVTVSGTLMYYKSGSNILREFNSCTITNIELPDYTVDIDDSCLSEGIVTKIEADRDSKIYKAGETVTITVEVQDGYIVTLVVSLANGELLGVTQVGNTFTFTITGDVTVSVTVESTKGRETLTILPDDTKLTTSGYQTGTFTKNEVVFSYTNLILQKVSGSNIIQWIKYSATKPGVLQNTTPISKKIISVTINTSNAAHFKLEFATQADFSDAVEASVQAAGNVATAYCSLDGAQYVRISYTNTSGVAQTSSIEIVYQGCTHDEAEQHGAVESTCSTQGYDEYWQCNDCGKLFSDALCTNEIAEPVKRDLLPHTWKIDTTKGDDNDGWTWNVSNGTGTATLALECTKCNATHNETVAVSYTEQASSSPCTVAGTGTYTASVTKDNIVGETASKTVTLELAPHTQSEGWFSDEQGHFHKCTVCQAQIEEEKLGHTYTRFETKDASEHTSRCDICTYEHTTAHTWAEIPTYVNESTHETRCTANGCTEAKDQTGHTYDDNKCACGATQDHAHNLVWAHNEKQHWKRCNVDNCDYIDETTRGDHDNFSGYSSNDDETHSVLCGTCNNHIDQDHTRVYSQLDGDAENHKVTCQFCEWAGTTEKHNFNGGKCTDCDANEPVYVWKRVTNASELSVGDQIILASGTNAMGAQSGTFRSSVTGGISVNNDIAKIENKDAVVIVTLEAGSGTSFVLHASDGYLYYTGTSNAVSTGTSVSGNSYYWNITNNSAANKFDIKNANSTSRNLQYNSNQPRFACYTSAQTAVEIFKLSASTGGGTVDPAPHECTDKCETCNLCTNAECQDPACLPKCGGHDSTGGGETGEPKDPVKVTINVKTVCEAAGYASGSDYSSLPTGIANITITASGTAKYYSSGSGTWRIYDGSITIAALNGYQLKSYKLTFTNGTFANVTSGTTYDVSGQTSVTISLSSTKNAQISEIVLEYIPV